MNHNDVDHDGVDHDDDVDHDLWHLLQLRGGGSKKSTLRPSFASLSHHACLICFLKICCLSDMFFKDFLLSDLFLKDFLLV